jgi:hypothetical protein
VNNGDTGANVSFTPPLAVGSERIPTVVSHCDIRHDLFEHDLAFDEFLVFGLGGMKFSAEFLCCGSCSFPLQPKARRCKPRSFPVGRIWHLGLVRP